MKYTKKQQEEIRRKNTIKSHEAYNQIVELTRFIPCGFLDCQTCAFSIQDANGLVVKDGCGYLRLNDLVKSLYGIKED